MMPTMSAASRPSRSIRKKAAVTVVSYLVWMGGSARRNGPTAGVRWTRVGGLAGAGGARTGRGCGRRRLDRAEEEEQHHHDVDEPDDERRDFWCRRVAEQGSEELTDEVAAVLAVRQHAGHVESRLRPDRDDADLDELVDGLREETGRDEDERDSGPPEERGQVETTGALVEADADDGGDEQAGDRADEDPD